MANETLYSSAVVLAAAVEAQIAPMFTAAAFMPKLVAAYAVGTPNTNAKKLPKSGTITASVVAEAAAATPQTLTDTSVTLTLQKAVVVTKPTAEALKFTVATTPERHAALAAQACAKKFDVDALALASGFSQVVDSTTSLTVAKLQEAAYTVRLGDIPTDTLAAVLHYKQAYQLGNDIRAATGTFFSNPNFNPGGATDAAQSLGFVTNLFGVNVYQTSNTLVDTAPTPDDNVGLVFAPQYAIAALYPEGNTPGFEVEIDGSVGFLESVKHIKTTMWYQVAEYVDTAGCRLISEI